MNFSDTENTDELLKSINLFLKKFFNSTSLEKNKILCQNQIKTELIIEDVKRDTFDGFYINRRFTSITHLPSFLDLKFIGMINNFSTMSSLISNKDDKTTKFISRFFDYKGENIHEKFLIPSFLTTMVSNERFLQLITKKILMQIDERSIDYDETVSKWSQNNDFEDVRAVIESKLACSASNNGITVELPWEEGAVSASMGQKTALLEIISNNKHPYFGTGLFCKLTLPIRPCDKNELSNLLNLHELSLDDAPPFIGSWCTGGEDNHMVFVAFFPNNIYYPKIVMSIIMWMNFRVKIIKKFIESNNSLII